MNEPLGIGSMLCIALALAGCAQQPLQVSPVVSAGSTPIPTLQSPTPTPTPPPPPTQSSTPSPPPPLAPAKPVRPTVAFLKKIKQGIDEKQIGDPNFVRDNLVKELPLTPTYPVNLQMHWYENKNIFDGYVSSVTLMGTSSSINHWLILDVGQRIASDAMCITPEDMANVFGNSHYDYHSSSPHPVRSADELPYVRGAYDYFYWVTRIDYLNLTFRFERRPCLRYIESKTEVYARKYQNWYPDRLDQALPPILYKFWKEAAP